MNVCTLLIFVFCIDSVYCNRHSSSIMICRQSGPGCHGFLNKLPHFYQKQVYHTIEPIIKCKAVPTHTDTTSVGIGNTLYYVLLIIKNHVIGISAIKSVQIYYKAMFFWFWYVRPFTIVYCIRGKFLGGTLSRISQVNLHLLKYNYEIFEVCITNVRGFSKIKLVKIVFQTISQKCHPLKISALFVCLFFLLILY